MGFSDTSVSERRFLPPAVAVSTVAFALQPPQGANIGDPTATAALDPEEVTLWIPLVRRTRPPFDMHWALPGGPIPWNETLVDTSLRTLRSAVGHTPGYLEQLFSFGEVGRSAAAQRLVTIAYWALYGEGDLAEPSGDPGTTSVDDPNVAWFSADRPPTLAFDHGEIVAHALDRLRSKTEYASLAHRFLGTHFTLAQLREVHEAILGAPIDPANFRRQVLAQGNLVDSGEMTSGTRHRPARLYHFREDTDQPTRSIA